jgi:hypothetical protein
MTVELERAPLRNIAESADDYVNDDKEFHSPI